MMQSDPRISERVAGCGWYTKSGVVEIRAIGGSVYPAQLIVCGRPWQEPVCGAKIRARKAVELENLVKVHIGSGGGVSLTTHTLEHHFEDSLESTLAVLRHAWDKLVHCNRWRRVKDAHGFLGLILAYEFTHSSREGWHPHIHALWIHREPLDARGLVDVHAFMNERWERGVTGMGRHLNPVKGVRLDLNAQSAAVGGYVAKVQEGDWTVAQEMTRGDVKAGRKGSRVPFSMLRDHYATGDMADWNLWREFSAAVLLGGNRSIPLCRMTPGLRAAILGNKSEPAMNDEQLALVEVGGELIAVVAWKTWVQIRQAGMGPALIAAGEQGGLFGINELLTGHGLGQADPP